MANHWQKTRKGKKSISRLRTFTMRWHWSSLNGFLHSSGSLNHQKQNQERTEWFSMRTQTLWLKHHVKKMVTTHVYQGHSGTGSLRLAPVSPEQGIKWMSFLGLKPTFLRKGTSFSLHSSYLQDNNEIWENKPHCGVWLRTSQVNHAEVLMSVRRT